MSVEAGQIGVYSEVGTLRRVLTHYPDRGIGGVIPSKAQEWLYEDIVHLKYMQKEYEYFRKILLAYLDPEVLRQWLKKERDGLSSTLSPASVSSPDFVPSKKVIDTEELLAEILSDHAIRLQLVASICAIEGTRHTIQTYLADPNELTPSELAKVFITGTLEGHTKLKDSDSGMLFAPIPNFLFTRDIGITIGRHLLLSKTALQSRKRESVLARYIAYYALFKGDPDKVIEISNNHDAFLLDAPERLSQTVTLEGGDVMMIAPNHVLIGYSERTTPHACEKVIQHLFKLKSCDIQKVSVVKLPHLRAMMHLDTVMTQVDRRTWVLFKQLVDMGLEDVRSAEIFEALGVKSTKAERLAKVSQFVRRGNAGFCEVNKDITTLKELLMDVSCNDYGCQPEEVKFIYSADGSLIHDEREQWTDSCNVTAIKEGVVLGYDRNDLTAKGFENAGFKSVCVKEVIDNLAVEIKENPEIDIAEYLAKHIPEKALLLVPSAELSRARGGPHCMTMPIERDYV
mgnify:CR=1 FL=1